MPQKAATFPHFDTRTYRLDGKFPRKEETLPRFEGNKD
jgi:hypothetical protein